MIKRHNIVRVCERKWLIWIELVKRQPACLMRRVRCLAAQPVVPPVNIIPSSRRTMSIRKDMRGATMQAKKIHIKPYPLYGA